MLAAIPSLDELLRDPSRLDGLDQGALAALALRAASATALVTARMSVAASAGPVPAKAPRAARQLPQDGPTISADEAAALLCKPRRWLFTHAHRLPFVRRISRKHLVCDEAGLRAWIAAKAATGA